VDAQAAENGRELGHPGDHLRPAASRDPSFLSSSLSLPESLEAMTPHLLGTGQRDVAVSRRRSGSSTAVVVDRMDAPLRKEHHFLLSIRSSKKRSKLSYRSLFIVGKFSPKSENLLAIVLVSEKQRLDQQGEQGNDFNLTVCLSVRPR
jgi:hypothetical protein